MNLCLLDSVKKAAALHETVKLNAETLSQDQAVKNQVLFHSLLKVVEKVASARNNLATRVLIRM